MSYIKIGERFFNFLAQHNHRKVCPATFQHVKQYIAHLFNIGLAPSTLLTHTSAIAFIHKIAGHADPTDNFFIKRMLSGAQKMKGSPDNRKPFLPQDIYALNAALHALPQPTYIKIMLKSMILLAFNAMLRVGEITSRSPKSCDSNNILFQNVQFSPNAATIIMNCYKHSKGQPVSIKIPEHKKNNLCPVKALKAYIVVRGQHSGPLYTLPNRDAVSCQFFNQQLNTLIIHSNLPQGRYSSHSLRIGGAFI